MNQLSFKGEELINVKANKQAKTKTQTLKSERCKQYESGSIKSTVDKLVT